MNIQIEFTGAISEEDSYQINHLSTMIVKECYARVALIREPQQQGERNEGLVVGIAIANLALTSISTLIGILAFWQSSQPKYSVSITKGNTTYQVDNISERKLDEIIDKLNAQAEVSETQILIAHK